MLMKYYFTGKSLAGDFRKSIPFDDNSLSMADLLTIAASENVHLKGVRLHEEDLDKNIYPAIIAWGVNHFAVLLRKDKGFVFVADPLFPVVRVSIEEFFKKSSGYALINQEGGLWGVNVGLCVDKTGVELTEKKNVEIITLFNLSDKIQKCSVASASCSCIDLPEKSFVLDPGELATVPIRLKDPTSIRTSKDMIAFNGSFDPFQTAIVRVYSTSVSAITLEPTALDFSLQRVGAKSVFVVKIEHPSGAIVSLGKKDIASGVMVGDVEVIKKRDKLSLVKVPIIWIDSGFIGTVISFNVDAGSHSEKVGINITSMVY